MIQAFEGVKVLDLSDRLSGAWAARLFGDFGAEVILSEPKEGRRCIWGPRCEWEATKYRSYTNS